MPDINSSVIDNFKRPCQIHIWRIVAISGVIAAQHVVHDKSDRLVPTVFTRRLTLQNADLCLNDWLMETGGQDTWRLGSLIDTPNSFRQSKSGRQVPECASHSCTHGQYYC